MSGKTKLTKAQIDALKMFKRRDWPAGEPRAGWVYEATVRVLLGRGLISLRPNSEDRRFLRSTPVVDLTEAGRAALSDLERLP